MCIYVLGICVYVFWNIQGMLLATGAVDHAARRNQVRCDVSTLNIVDYVLNY